LFVVGGFGELVDQWGAGEVADPSAGFGELVDQWGAGEVADPSAGFGGAGAQRDEQMGLMPTWLLNSLQGRVIGLSRSA
jgi:hypothetical protein